MTLQEILNTYIDGDYIKPMKWENCLKSKEDLYNLLKCWFKICKSESIGKNPIGVAPIVLLQIGDKRYKLNSDTKREGVKTFLENSKLNNIWYISESKRVSNDVNGQNIKNLHMYLL